MVLSTIGCVFAMFSAALWAFGVILFRKLGDDISPIGINIAKSSISVICLGFLFLFIAPVPMSLKTYLCLGGSGLLGVTLGDTFYLKSLMEIGPKASLALTLLIPVVTVFLALIILQEQLSLITFLGIMFTLFGVYLVLQERYLYSIDKIRNLNKGIKYGVLSVFSCSFSIILSKSVIESASILDATFVRQLWGGAGLILLGLLSSKLKSWIKPFSNPLLLRNLIFAALVSTCLGAFFSLAALKYIDASVATVLNATSPLFILPLAYFFLKEKITFHAVIGTLTALIGVGLIIFGGK